MKYRLVVVIQDKLTDIIARNKARYEGLFKGFVQGERPALSLQNGEIFAWFESGRYADAGAIRQFVPRVGEGEPKPVFHTFAEDPESRDGLLGSRFGVGVNLVLKFRECEQDYGANILTANLEPGNFDREIRYERPGDDHRNLFLAPLILELDSEVDEDKGTLQFLLSDGSIAENSLVLPPTPIPDIKTDYAHNQLEGMDPNLETLRTLIVSDFFERFDFPPAGIVALRCSRNSYIRDSIVEGAYIRFVDTLEGRKLQLAMPNTLDSYIQRYRADFLAEDDKYGDWQYQLRYDLLKPMFEFFAPFPERVKLTGDVDNESLRHSCSLSRFAFALAGFSRYKNIESAGRVADEARAQIRRDAEWTKLVMDELAHHANVLTAGWEEKAPASYKFLRKYFDALPDDSKHVVLGHTHPKQEITNIGLSYSIFWPILRPFLGRDRTDVEMDALGLPSTYSAFFESLYLLADSENSNAGTPEMSGGVVEAIRHYLDYSGLVGFGTDPERLFLGPIHLENNDEFLTAEPMPLALCYQQLAQCVRASILLHLLCPLHIRIIPGVSIQSGAGFVDDSEEMRLRDSLRLVAQLDEGGLGYLVPR